MSFSSNSKEELSKLNNLGNKKQVKAELIGYLISNNTIVVGKRVKFSTESQYNINRFSKLLNNMSIINYKIDMSGKSFVITFDLSDVNDFVKNNENRLYITEVENDEELIKALIRGIFLGSGSMNNPENTYHLEIAISTEQNASLVRELLEYYEIYLKTLDSKKSYCLYIKDGEEISKFLAFIGANNSVLKFEEIRVVRNMNNKVNRLVNCETANMNKTMNAAVEQIEAIEFLKKKKQYEKLEDSLKEIANVRLEHPDSPLSELGKYLKEPIGKSGVNYRLKKIIKIAEELKSR